MPILAAYFHRLDPVILQIPGTPIALRWYGLAYVLGFVLGYLLLHRLSVRKLYCVAPDKLFDFIVLVCFAGVILGGRLGEFFFYWLPEYGLSGLRDDPFWVFRVWEGGMASHGGIIAVLTVAILYARRNKLPFAGVCDGLAIVCPIGLFFGRIANFINGELYGRICPPDSPLAVRFPTEYADFTFTARMEICDALSASLGTAVPPNIPVLARNGVPESMTDFICRLCRQSDVACEQLSRFLNTRYPSQIFEALGEGLIILIILVTVRFLWRKAPDGIFSALFCFLYAAARITCECFKEPDAPTWGPVTRGQYLSFGIIALGCFFLAFALRSGRKKISVSEF